MQLSYDPLAPVSDRWYAFTDDHGQDASGPTPLDAAAALCAVLEAER